MSNPSVPNYKPGVGRLVTDRSDFQNHITGSDFRHKADQIDLNPTVTLESNEITTVQDAIYTLSAMVVPPSIPDATPFTKGVIQLTGDLSGAADNVSVIKLQNKAVSSLTPNNGDILTWDASTSVWKPLPPANTFSAAGDLSGNNITQQVVGLTGSSNSTRVSCNSLTFISTVTPSIIQSTTANNGVNFTIEAQTTTVNSKNGGALILRGGGVAGGGGLRGGVQLHVGSGGGATPILQTAEIASGRRILSILNTSALTTSDMPSFTGDMVMYVRDTATPPTIGSPINGTIVYSYGGQLWVKQQDGNNFYVGSAPNPNIWGSTGQEVYSTRVFTGSSVGAATTALTFPLPDNMVTKVDVTFVGKTPSAANGATFNLTMSYLRNSASAPVAMGSTTSSNAKTTAGAAAAWVIPTISTSGNNLIVSTGYSTLATINWFVVVQLSMCQA